jgi:DNA replication protein DnaC
MASNGTAAPSLDELRTQLEEVDARLREPDPDFHRYTVEALQAEIAEISVRVAQEANEPRSLDSIRWELRRNRAQAELDRKNGNGKAHDEPKKTQQPVKFLFETMTTVEEEEIDWLWQARIPRGKLTLFDGDPGVGKSYVSLAIVAAISRGNALPFDKEPEAPLKSWIISAEDTDRQTRSSPG